MNNEERSSYLIGWVAIWTFRTLGVVAIITVAGWLYTAAVPPDFANIVGLVLWMLLVGAIADRAISIGRRGREP